MGRVNKEWRGRRRNSPHLLFTVSSHTTSGYHIPHSLDIQDRLIPLFYIKRQQRIAQRFASSVVLYLCSTSNHNTSFGVLSWRTLFYTFVLHQTTTGTGIVYHPGGCFIPLFYIKPQQRRLVVLYPSVVLYLCSTSNHNLFLDVVRHPLLFYTFVLHQTTTPLRHTRRHPRCFIPLFYIKPQHDSISASPSSVVLYLCSTSNHN